MSLTKWEARLRKEKTPTFLQPDAFDEGYYRKPVVEKLPNGRWKTLDYIPVAYFMDGNRLVGLIGDLNTKRDMTDDELSDEGLWSWVVANPIPYEWYEAVADHGLPWPDEAQWMSTITEEVPAGDPENPAEPAKPRHEVLATKIKAEIDAAIKSITNEDEANKAAGSMNKLAELRLTATKEGEALYKPPFKEYKRLYDLWNPMVGDAQKTEKRLNTAILTFRESERKKAAAAAAEAARIKQEQDEAAERAVQRSIARGEPEALPVITEAAPETPAPAPVQPTYGSRKPREEVKKFAVIDDWSKVFAHFSTDADLRARLEKLATDAIRAGADVPGATYREGFI